MGPLGELVRRVHRVLVLLVVACYRHACAVVLEGMGRHALVDIFVGHLDFAGELDIVVLSRVSQCSVQLIEHEGKMTYSELANLDVVDAKGFFFLASTEAQDGYEFADEVEGAEDQAGTDERIGAAGKGVGELVAELDPMVVQPAAGDDAVAVEMCNVVTEETLARKRGVRGVMRLTQQRMQ